MRESVRPTVQKTLLAAIIFLLFPWPVPQGAIVKPVPGIEMLYGGAAIGTIGIALLLVIAFLVVSYVLSCLANHATIALLTVLIFVVLPIPVLENFCSQGSSCANVTLSRLESCSVSSDRICIAKPSLEIGAHLIGVYTTSASISLLAGLGVSYLLAFYLIKWARKLWEKRKKKGPDYVMMG